jgi:hypothetical protein
VLLPRLPFLVARTLLVTAAEQNNEKILFTNVIISRIYSVNLIATYVAT